MALTGNRTFVGFGFGAIQAGLFLYEAFQSGGFRRLVVAEVNARVVEDLRRNQGYFSFNIAHRDRVETARIGPVQIENPSVASDLARLVDAAAKSEEMATAVPSVDFYKIDGPGSIHRILAEGLREKVRMGGPRAVIYAAENHNHAAEILRDAVFEAIPSGERGQAGERVRFLNTVIGKMSGIVSAEKEAETRRLTAVTPDNSRVLLVEEFNRILVSEIDFPTSAFEPKYQRGISILVEKPDLLPFEEAKLYGHNAAHALAAYLCAMRGYAYIADLRRDANLLEFVRDAFLRESGEAMIRAHPDVDPLFTPRGYEEYVLDLLDRMTNPYLLDSVERVGRDPRRKLGWDDRLVGTMRLAIRYGITPRRFAIGASAALATLDPVYLENRISAVDLLKPVWNRDMQADSEARHIFQLMEEARPELIRWRNSDFREPLI